jgi:hypothetical protein
LTWWLTNRLGTNPPLASEFVIRFDRSDNRFGHRQCPSLYSLSVVQQCRIFVSTISFKPVSDGQLIGRNKYFRSTPLEYGLVSLGGYLRFWALIFLVVTAWLAFVKKEDAVSENDPDMDVKKVYKVMWSIIRLKSMSSQPTFDLY